MFTIKIKNETEIMNIWLISGGKAEELDSDDLDDEDDEDDEAEEEESEEQTGAETLGNLRRYMDEMDQELQTTNVGQSFTYNSKVSANCQLNHDIYFR